LQADPVQDVKGDTKSKQKGRGAKAKDEVSEAGTKSASKKRKVGLKDDVSEGGATSASKKRKSFMDDVEQLDDLDSGFLTCKKVLGVLDTKQRDVDVCAEQLKKSIFGTPKSQKALKDLSVSLADHKGTLQDMFIKKKTTLDKLKAALQEAVGQLQATDLELKRVNAVLKCG